MLAHTASQYTKELAELFETMTAQRSEKLEQHSVERIPPQFKAAYSAKLLLYNKRRVPSVAVCASRRPPPILP